ncbi:hypothetical protein [Streptomyces sp. NPDC046939]|uniref:hypothetical protein n=1 Tax=Streptomyces sp. NPDC046939 TaxID=3155376 RepID=UPI00341177AD
MTDQQGSAADGNRLFVMSGNTVAALTVLRPADDRPTEFRHNSTHRRTGNPKVKRRTKHITLWTTLTAALLGITAYVAEPTVRDHLVARDVCDGAVPKSVVNQLTPDDVHLKESKARRIPGLGSYTCTLTVKARENDARDWPLLRMEAYTGADDQDREMRVSFPQFGTEYHEALPGGLPGFVDRLQNIVLRVPCRGDGAPDALLTRVSVARDALHGVPGAAYRAAASFTDAAARRLGCDTAPLKVTGAAARAALADPAARDDDKAPVRSVPVPDAARTACGWAATAGLPHADQWTVTAKGRPTSMTATCALTGPDPETQTVTLHAWYGDWGTRFLSRGSSSAVRDPMTAITRCDGTRANFSLTTAHDAAKHGIDDKLRERLLRAFVKDQMARAEHCADQPEFTP